MAEDLITKNYHRNYWLRVYSDVDISTLNNKQKRSYRLSRARQFGFHSKKEWLEMKAFFKNTCAMCFGEKGYPNVEKDHILPLFIDGSSDGLENLQPLCAHCNSCKSDAVDYRPQLAEYLGLTLPKKYTNG
jgi:5-methylcytosine-specific restriction endonuclease McrA